MEKEIDLKNYESTTRLKYLQSIYMYFICYNGGSNADLRYITHCVDSS